MTENPTHATTSAAGSQADQAATAELQALNPEQQQIVRDVMAVHPSLTVEEALQALNEAGM